MIEKLCAHSARPGRCPQCSRIVPGSAPSGQQSRVKRTWAERQRRKAAVDAHRAQHGDWCPGIDGLTTPHTSDKLTAHHLEPQSAGGTEGPLVVVCVSCNSKAGALGGVPSYNPKENGNDGPLVR